MRTAIPVATQHSRALTICLLAGGSVALTLGLACAVPLAGLAAVAAMLLPNTAAFGGILAVWLANQVVGFLWLGYPTDASTLAWGVALGVIAVGCVWTAQLILARMRGPTWAAAALTCAFGVYEGTIYLLCLSSGTDVSHFTAAIVARLFLVNAAATAVPLMVRSLALRTRLWRRLDAALELQA